MWRNSNKLWAEYPAILLKQFYISIIRTRLFDELSKFQNERWRQNYTGISGIIEDTGMGSPLLSKFQAGDGFVCFQCFEPLTGCLLACLLCLFTVYSSSTTLNACSRNDAFKPECISKRFRPFNCHLYRMFSVLAIRKYRSETENQQISL